MKILITGMSGVGKSTVCQRLRDRGCNAYDLDVVESLCALYHADGSLVHDYENRRDFNILETEYLCNVQHLEKHMQNQPHPVFYCGFIDNTDDVAKCFDRVVLLTTSPDENKRRMTVRTTTEFAKDEKTQNALLSFKEEWETSVQRYNPIVLDASPDPDTVTDMILEAFVLP